MNLEETTLLCKAIATLAPVQRFEPDTPSFWAVILADVAYDDARQAILNLARRQPFIAPADIIGEVRAIRWERLEGADRITPDADPDDVSAYLAELRSIRGDVAAGRREPPPRQAISAGIDPGIARIIEGVRLGIEADRADQARAAAEAKAAEDTERARQLAALEAMPPTTTTTEEQAPEVTLDVRVSDSEALKRALAQEGLAR